MLETLFKNTLHLPKIQHIITHKMLMLTYKSYYNISPFYLCELITRKGTFVNTRLGADHHQLIMVPISKDCSNIFLNAHSFMLLHANGTNQTSSFKCLRNSVKTILFTQQYRVYLKQQCIKYCYFCYNHC